VGELFEIAVDPGVDCEAEDDESEKEEEE